MKIIMNIKVIHIVFNGCLEEKLQIYNSTVDVKIFLQI